MKRNTHQMEMKQHHPSRSSFLLALSHSADLSQDLLGMPPSPGLGPPPLIFSKGTLIKRNTPQKGLYLTCLLAGLNACWSSKA